MITLRMQLARPCYPLKPSRLSVIWLASFVPRSFAFGAYQYNQAVLMLLLLKHQAQQLLRASAGLWFPPVALSLKPYT